MDRDLGKPPIRTLVAGDMPLRRTFAHTWREVTTEAGEHGWIQQRIYNMNGLPVLVERALPLDGFTASRGYERFHEALVGPLESLWKRREAGGLARRPSPGGCGSWGSSCWRGLPAGRASPSA